MRPVKIFQGWGGRGIKENDGGDEFNYDKNLSSYSTMSKNFCKCHNVPPAQ
jgi:hypothetical protein